MRIRRFFNSLLQGLITVIFPLKSACESNHFQNLNNTTRNTYQLSVVWKLCNAWSVQEIWKSFDITYNVVNNQPSPVICSVLNIIVILLSVIDLNKPAVCAEQILQFLYRPIEYWCLFFISRFNSNVTDEQSGICFGNQQTLAWSFNKVMPDVLERQGLLEFVIKTGYVLDPWKTFCCPWEFSGVQVFE